jgi:hypothetical protein
MNKTDSRSLKVAIVVTIAILLLLIYLPAPAFSQQNTPPTIQNLIVNGSFEGGFQQDFGIGYGWGGFSNGNAVVGWNFDSWAPVVPAGEYSQSIEIKDALSHDRYAGVYQTISVTPGAQYKLTIKGLIRSDEGDIALSDYGYRLQYAVDYKGDTAWELLPMSAWQELPWDEQSLGNPESQTYKFNTFETTITAQSDKLTLFIRGWKKWINNGTGLFNLDEISFVGPAPAGFQAPVAQTASAGNVEPRQPAAEPGSGNPVAAEIVEPAEETALATETEPVAAPQADPAPTQADQMTTGESPVMAEGSTTQTTPMEKNAAEQTEAMVEVPAQTEQTAQTETTLPAAPADPVGNAAHARAAELPVSGLGSDDSMPYVLMVGITLLLILFVGAVTATLRHRSVVE